MILDKLTPDDITVLMQAEDEVSNINYSFICSVVCACACACVCYGSGLSIILLL